MKKKDYKRTCRNLEQENKIMFDIISQGIKGPDSCTMDENTSELESKLDFIENNVRQSGTLEALKSLEAAKRAQVDHVQQGRDILEKVKKLEKYMNTMQKHQKANEKFLNKAEKQMCLQSMTIDRLEKKLDKVQQKNKKLQSDVKLIKVFFMRGFSSYGYVGGSFKKEMKKYLKRNNFKGEDRSLSGFLQDNECYR